MPQISINPCQKRKSSLIALQIATYSTIIIVEKMVEDQCLLFEWFQSSWLSLQGCLGALLSQKRNVVAYFYWDKTSVERSKSSYSRNLEGFIIVCECVGCGGSRKPFALGHVFPFALLLMAYMLLRIRIICADGFKSIIGPLKTFHHNFWASHKMGLNSKSIVMSMAS